MVWLIIGIIFFVIGVLMCVICCSDCESAAVGGTLIAFGVIIAAVWFSFFIHWNVQASMLKEAPTIIDNKIVKIQMMKESYIPSKTSGTVAIELANTDLASGINEQIVDLEKTINRYNDIIISWRVRYEWRAWNACYVKPPLTKLIKMSDYRF
jgi:hypothetical protein